MEAMLSNQIFEWLLAEWAGFGDNPDELFPSLTNVDHKTIADELDQIIRLAQISQEKRAI